MRPRLLDLFSGAGGCSVGYERAGFDVIGVDIVAQPNYPFDFYCTDALEVLRSVRETGLAWLLDDGWVKFDAIHASPPCQAHSTIAKQQRVRRPGEYEDKHVDLVAETRELLEATGLPYVIENVPGAPLLNPITLCGSSFGLDVRRHRLFETNFPIMSLPCSHGSQAARFHVPDKRLSPDHRASVVGVYGNSNYAGHRELREKAMGIDWMSPYELTQAIPPAYTEHIGEALMTHIVRSQADKEAA